MTPDVARHPPLQESVIKKKQHRRGGANASRRGARRRWLPSRRRRTPPVAVLRPYKRQHGALASVRLRRQGRPLPSTMTSSTTMPSRWTRTTTLASRGVKEEPGRLTLHLQPWREVRNRWRTFYFWRAPALSSCQPPQMLMAALPPTHCHPFRRRFDGRGQQPREDAATRRSRTTACPTSSVSR